MKQEKYMLDQQVMEYITEEYVPAPAKTRYGGMVYKRCGNSGILMPLISLGLSINFGYETIYQTSRDILLTAFDLGITHFDMANQYGPYFGGAEETFGKIYRNNLRPYRDELLLATKAGWEMWPGPYGEHGSRKHLMASIDHSLKRTGLEYFDIFYHHRPDEDTPLEETMQALSDIVKQGKALYVGLSRYSPERLRQASAILRRLGTPCLVETYGYSMYERWSEKGLHQALEDEGVGSACFFPLAQGLLTDKYLGGIPKGSRADITDKKRYGMDKDVVTADKVEMSRQLNELAKERGQSLAQMALAWVLRKKVVATCVVGASRAEQVRNNVDTVKNLDFAQEELDRIEAILGQYNGEMEW